MCGRQQPHTEAPCGRVRCVRVCRSGVLERKSGVAVCERACFFRLTTLSFSFSFFVGSLLPHKSRHAGSCHHHGDRRAQSARLVPAAGEREREWVEKNGDRTKAGLFLDPHPHTPLQPPPATFKRPQTLVYAVSTARGAALDALPLSKDGAAAPARAAPASLPPANLAPTTTTPFPDPPYVTLAGVTLRYAGWFREAVPGCAAEGEGRVRKVVLALHPSDSTATLLEPRAPNSGLDQGVLVRRHALMVGGVPLTADGVAVGTSVSGRRGGKRFKKPEKKTRPQHTRTHNTTHPFPTHSTDQHLWPRRHHHRRRRRDARLAVSLRQARPRAADSNARGGVGAGAA